MSNKIMKVIFFTTVLLSIILASCAPQAAATPASTDAPTATEVTTQPVVTEALAATEAPTNTATAPQPAVGGTFIFTSSQVPDTLDPQVTALAAAANVINLTNATLLAQDINGNFIPYLAESYEVSPDGLVYTFKLKSGLNFDNGDPITTTDIKYTFDRFLDPNFVTNASKAIVDYLDKIEIVDDLTIKFTMKTAKHSTIGEFAGRTFAPISKRAVEELGENFGRQPVGSGPYIFKEWITDEKIVLTRNPDYNWGPAYFEGANTGPWYFDTIEYRFINEYATLLAGLETGEINMGNVQAKDLPLIEGTGLFNMFNWPAGGVSYVIFNDRCRTIQ